MESPPICLPKQWAYQPLPSPSSVAELATSLGIAPSLATLLLQRGVSGWAGAKAFFTPAWSALHDPFLLRGMQKAVEAIEQAIAEGKPMLVYGDYDVDGVTSVTLLLEGFQRLGGQVSGYIPDRYEEGYGLSRQGVDHAVALGTQLLITIDCGTRAVDLIAYARAQGITVIVCDHHQIGPVEPDALALLNPQHPACPYPFKGLSGCGIGFKLLQALGQRRGWTEEHLTPGLDLVALSIAADIVPMVGENRILAHHGLVRLNTALRPGLVTLLAQAQLTPTSPLTIEDLVFKIAPRLNAAGRLQHAYRSVELLLAPTAEQATPHAQAINAHNQARKSIDQAITEAVGHRLAAEPGAQARKTIVLFDEAWHKGVLGIAAARCVERYHKPTILLTAHKGQATGSARSVEGFNLYKALQACAPLFSAFGGHACAAGLTLPLAHLPALTQAFEAQVAARLEPSQSIPRQPIDLPLELADWTARSYRVLERMAPFGPGHRRPVWASYPVWVVRHACYQQQHLKLYLRVKGSPRVWEAIGFHMAGLAGLVTAGQPLAIAYTLTHNTYRGRTKLQLLLKDIKRYEPSEQAALQAMANA